jgi:hypothetical protein
MANDEKSGAGSALGIDGYLFRLIATFEGAAMQQMGKIAHPLTGDVEVDLQGASDSVEMLAAIQRKTEGNLNADEKRLLDHVLYQLRMNYVDVAAEQAKNADAEQAKSADAEQAKSADGEQNPAAPGSGTAGPEETEGGPEPDDAATDAGAPDPEKETA